MIGVAAHAFLEPYIGVSATKVTNKLHPATLSPIPRPISSTPALHSIRSHALFLAIIRTPLPTLLHPSPSTPTLHSIRFHALFLVTICTTSPTPSPYFPTTCASPPTFLRILPRAPTHPLSRTYAPLSRTHVSSLTHPHIFSHAPTHPLSRTYASLPPLTGRRPIAYTFSIPHTHENLQRITRTYLPIARTPPSTYTHLFPLLYVDARPLIRISSTTCTYLFDKSFKRFI